MKQTKKKQDTEPVKRGSIAKSKANQDTEPVKRESLAKSKLNPSSKKSLGSATNPGPQNKTTTSSFKESIALGGKVTRPEPSMDQMMVPQDQYLQLLKMVSTMKSSLGESTGAEALKLTLLKTQVEELSAIFDKNSNPMKDGINFTEPAEKTPFNSPASEFLFTGDSRGTLSQISIATKKTEKEYTDLHTRAISNMMFTRDGKFLITIDAGGGIKQINIKD